MDLSIPQLVLGNALADGTDFFAWFIGPLSQWAAQNKPSPPKVSDYSLRQNSAIRVKLHILAAGEKRGQWTEPNKDEETVTLGLVTTGQMHIRLRPHGSDSVLTEFTLNDAEYAIWPDKVYSHDWIALQPTTIVTVRWLPTLVRSEASDSR